MKANDWLLRCSEFYNLSTLVGYISNLSNTYNFVPTKSHILRKTSFFANIFISKCIHQFKKAIHNHTFNYTLYRYMWRMILNYTYYDSKLYNLTSSICYKFCYKYLVPVCKRKTLFPKFLWLLQNCTNIHSASVFIQLSVELPPPPRNKFSCPSN